MVLNEKNNSLSLPLLMPIGEEIIWKTESVYALSVFFVLCLIVKIFHSLNFKTSSFGFEKTPNWLAKDAL